MKSTDKLHQFRRQCEQDTGQSASEIEVPLASVLDDICRLFGLPTKDRRKVLGRSSYTRLEDDRTWGNGQVKPRTPRH
jgi:hypothetical protein